MPKSKTDRILAFVCAAMLATLMWAVCLNRNAQSLQLGSKSYRMLLAIDQESRERGLSGLSEHSLHGKAMVFVVPEPSEQCIWMKDMRFGIDVLWLNQQQVVTQIEPNMQPASYPQIFCGPETTKYVIEVPEGDISRSGVWVGTQLNFQTNN